MSLMRIIIPVLEMRTFLAATAFALTFSMSSHAATSFTDQVAFDVATSNPVTLDDFNNVGGTSFFGPGEVVDRGVYSLTQLEEVVGFSSSNGTGGSPAIVLGFSSAAASLQFDLDTPVGGIFFDTSTSGGTQTYNIAAGAEQLTVSFGAAQGFLGIQFDAPVTTFTITDVDASGNGYLDNFGTTDSVASPNEPSIPKEIPTLSNWAMIILIGLMLSIALVFHSRHLRHTPGR